MNMVEILKDSAKSAHWTGIALVVIGLLALAAPLAAGLSMTLLIGALIAFSGLLQLGLVFGAGSIGRGLFFLLFGLLGLLGGGYMILQPAAGLASLTLILAQLTSLRAASSSSWLPFRPDLQRAGGGLHSRPPYRSCWAS